MTRQMPYEPLPASVLFALGRLWMLLLIVLGKLWKNLRPDDPSKDKKRCNSAKHKTRDSTCDLDGSDVNPSPTENRAQDGTLNRSDHHSGN